MGLRELKKGQTRQLIADTAWRLIADRGFDRVTVAEVAREAQVAEATVFNYFPTKQDLFFDRLDAFGTRLVEAIRTRVAGQTVLAAFRDHLLDQGGLLAQIEAGDRQALERARTVNRVIAESPALQAREQQAITRCADALAALLAEETNAADGDLSPQVAANALMGVHRALIDYVRRRILAEDAPTRLATDVREHYGSGIALLEHGLGNYAPKPSSGDVAAAASR
jgi:AcrR family transcriptional regulator